MARATLTLTQHFVGIRLRVEGSGNLQLKLMGPSEVRQNILVPLIMQSSTDETKTKLANFKAERVKLEFKTTEIDEVFNISRIIIYSKPVSDGNPG